MLTLRPRWLNLLLLYFGVLSLTFFVYWGLWDTFYQQDEWYTHGHELIESVSAFFFSDYTYGHLFFGEGRMLSRLLYSFFVHSFSFPIAPVAFFSIAVHAFNVLLVYLLGERLTKKWVFAGIGASIFAINNVGQEAIAWMAASVGTLPATTFILLAVCLYLRFLESADKKFLAYAFLSWFVSLQFKEMGIAFLFLFPALAWFDQKKCNLRAIIKKSWPFLLYGGLAVAFRLVNLFMNAAQRGSAHVSGDSFIETVGLNLIVYPTVSLFQSLVPVRDMYELSLSILTKVYPFISDLSTKDLLARSVMSDVLAFVGGIVLLGLIFAANRWLAKTENRFDWRLFAVFLFWHVLSFVPYAALNRGGSYLESRYYYLGIVSVGFMVASLLTILIERRSLWRLAGIIFIVWFVSYHASLIRDGMGKLIGTSQDRKRVFTSIEQAHSIQENKNVIYITGDREYYPKHRVPLLNGTGYALMVWFYHTGKIPDQLLREDWLWELGGQGYREFGDIGFGYYSDIEELKMTYVKYALEPKNVTGYYWDSSKRTMTDITEKVRAQLIP